MGHAAIELAVWAGATVVATVSGAEKAALATAAGAHHVVNYRESGADRAIREAVTDGVDLIVEVNPVANATLDREVIAENGAIASYASDPDDLSIDVGDAMQVNTRYQFVLVYTMPTAAKEQAIADISRAMTAGVLRIGEDAGLPIHRFPLEQTADAHAAVEANAVGKVLIDVSPG